MQFRKAFSLLELSIVIVIIGILVAGVTQGSRLIAEMKYSGARVLTKSSDVNSIPDLALWLETTSAKSFTTDRPDDGTAIAQWNDINPQIIEARKTNAINATTGIQPIYREGIFNGLPALRFDGVDDYLTVADGFDNDTENVTIFLVWKVNISSVAEMDLLEKWEGANGYPYVLRSTSGYYMHSYDGALGPGPGSATQRKIDAPVVIAARRIKSGIMNLWINGTKEGGDPTDTTTANTSNAARLGICARTSASKTINYCNGDIAEIIIFARDLKDEEKKSVEKYLGKKWGIRVN